MAAGSVALAQAMPPRVRTVATGVIAQSATTAQLPSDQPGSISGIVVDGSGALVARAHVLLTRDDSSPSQELLSGEDGRFSFAQIVPGSFHLTISSTGLETTVSSGLLHPGEACVVPQIVLPVATAVTEMRVSLSAAEIEQEQVKDLEKQRVFGVVPNFFVSYAHDPDPLTAKQKFALAWKTTTDPVTFAVIGVIAGVQQSQNDFSGYGQGVQGYAKRYGASYADLVSGTFLGSAILPTLLKQDPRYFYKGNGSKRSRILYALANAVICKGDNGHWQTNYSNILGNLATGGLSNLYYPASDRNGARLTFENALIGISTTGAINVLQEFLIPKLTPRIPRNDPAQP
jgi:hypothetical protein